jgi:hypothetical protein
MTIFPLRSDSLRFGGRIFNSDLIACLKTQGD